MMVSLESTLGQDHAMSTHADHFGSFESPIFLVGAERSGSTMLRLMLDHHPAIAFEHEFDLVVDRVADDGALPDLGSYHEYLNSVLGMYYAVDTSLTYRELVNDFLRQKQQSSGAKPIVGATLHHHFHRLASLWPRARYIHLLRDPRDVARSVVQKGWAGNLYQGAAVWSDAESCWSRLVSRLAPHQYIEVRYEDLVSEVEPQLARICRFIGVRYDPVMLEYQRSAKQYPKPDPSLAFHWREVLSPQEAGWVEARVGRLLETRGYGPRSRAEAVGTCQRAFFVVESRARVLRTRVRDLGLPLVLLDLIGRRLHIAALARYARRQIRAFQEATLAQEAAGLRAPSANLPTVSTSTLQRSA
jgi:hypothetical protein